MSTKIQLGEKVIGSTGSGKFGTRQVIGEYAGQVEDNLFLIRVTKKILGQPYIDCERCYNIRRVK